MTKSRYRVESSDGVTTRVTDLASGEDISSRCIACRFIHDPEKTGVPVLEITTRDYAPCIAVDSRDAVDFTSVADTVHRFRKPDVVVQASEGFRGQDLSIQVVVRRDLRWRLGFSWLVWDSACSARE